MLPYMNHAVEFVEWNMPALEEAAIGVVSLYRNKLRTLGTRRWVKFAVEKVLSLFRGKDSTPVELEGDGFKLKFFGPRPFMKPIIEKNGLVWRPDIPRVVFEDLTGISTFYLKLF